MSLLSLAAAGAFYVALPLVSASAHRAPAPAAEPAPISSPHHIDCFTSRGDVLRTFDSDPAGPYYATGAGGHVIFLDRKTHLMTRLSLSNCVETWQPGASY